MEQADLLRFVIEVLERLKIPYMLVGSMASGVYGEPRMTQDIDLVVELSAQQLEQLCIAFPASDFYVSVEAARSAMRQGGQFNIIDPSSGNKIDFMIARNDAWGQEQLARRQLMQILPGREGFTARPEDIILSKMLYYHEGGSEKHLRDIAGMLKVSGDKIDMEYVKQWAETLHVMEIWEAVVRRVLDEQP